MGTVAQRLGLRVFIDGIEVPAIGAKCNFQEGGPATAEIQLVPTDEIYGIEPRAFVTVFYYETFDYERTASGDLTQPARGPKDLRRWKLMFSGELIGIKFQKDSRARMATLTCMDVTNYWDYIKQHYLNFSNGGIEFFENAFLGVKLDRIKTFDIPGVDFESNLYNWLVKSLGPNGKPNMYLGVQRALHEMFFAVNDFYARAFNRLRMGDTLVGVPGDETSAKLYEMSFFKKFITNQIGGKGGEYNVRQIVATLLGTVFHTYVTVPCPMFDRAGKARAQIDSAEIQSELISREGAWPGATLNSTIIKPDSWFMAPPLCNVIFPHQYASLSFSRNYLAEPTRLFLRTSLLFAGHNDKYITERFYSPDFDEMNALMYKEGGFMSRMASTLLKSEQFTGINAIQTWQADLGAYVASGPRKGYLARVTDYLFWKARFGTRQVGVTGPFNPNVVCGYPAVVLDRVGSPGTLSRHYIGNVSSVTHSITQVGGHTYLTLSGARVHDETADFDGKGRSLEEVASRGTDGFLDDRYDTNRIGKEVYELLFGCGSIVDFLLGLDITDTTGENVGAGILAGVKDLIAKVPGEIAPAVYALQLAYQQVIQAGADVNIFTQSLTWRPKANLIEMMGLDIGIGDVNVQYSLDGYVGTDVLFDNEYLDNYDGFFSTAVNPEAPSTVNATFTATTGRTIPTATATEIPAVTVTVGGEEVVVQAARSDTSTTYTEVAKGTEGNYELASHLEARQTKVKEYVASLRQRGVRG